MAYPIAAPPATMNVAKPILVMRLLRRCLAVLSDALGQGLWTPCATNFLDGCATSQNRPNAKSRPKMPVPIAKTSRIDTREGTQRVEPLKTIRPDIGRTVRLREPIRLINCAFWLIRNQEPQLIKFSRAAERMQRDIGKTAQVGGVTGTVRNVSGVTRSAQQRRSDVSFLLESAIYAERPEPALS